MVKIEVTTELFDKFYLRHGRQPATFALITWN